MNETHYFGTGLSAKAIGEEYLGTMVGNRFIRADTGECVAVRDDDGSWYDMSDYWLPDAYLTSAEDVGVSAYNTAD